MIYNSCSAAAEGSHCEESRLQASPCPAATPVQLYTLQLPLLQLYLAAILQLVLSCKAASQQAYGSAAVCSGSPAHARPRPPLPGADREQKPSRALLSTL